MNVTLGGDRLGSGNKNKIALRNYERSTHNLSQKWTSSMTVGALYPFLVLPAMRGDKFEIDLAAAARTIPTQGPLFGSFKMQLDVFQCPVRLYQAILHNNPTNIGLQMNQVKFPKIYCHTTAYMNEIYKGMEFSQSCLMKYLGVSGLFSRILASSENQDYDITRSFNAIPVLAYYDIFKNYYSNKQEENAYVITPQIKQENANILGISINEENNAQPFVQYKLDPDTNKLIVAVRFDSEVPLNTICSNNFIGIYGLITGIANSQFFSPESINDQLSGVSGITYISDGKTTKPYDDFTDILDAKSKIWIFDFVSRSASFAKFIIEDLWQDLDSNSEIFIEINKNQLNPSVYKEYNLQLTPFKLKNIDDMRMKILSWNNVGTPFMINDQSSGDGYWGATDGSDNTGLPYVVNTRKLRAAYVDSANSKPLNGLVVKTYQSDIFNNWVQTEWIDGENGIAAITAIDTSDGSFSIDTLNLSEKLYNMLNRIAVSGGTYEDWQDAVYMESPRRHMESPIYLGGMSSEVVFEEIIQSAPTEGSPLGTLGGRGILVKRKGGKINVKVDEASFIIGIVSLTPRLNYSQGNEWYMTDLESMDDLHKPALDGIGFQNLMAEQLAWFGTRRARTGAPVRAIVGKVPAWINYMTAVDKVYGDLAEGENSFMVLNRNYEKAENGGIADVTTYIDPTKYNYAFAYKALDAQNFWVQINCDIKARRLMSAKQIPNI